MRLFVVRHGETQYNRERRMQGYQEIPLNDRGIAQAAQVAGHLLGEGVDRIVCSDLRRAVMTGTVIAAQCAVPMRYNVGLRERDPGSLVEQSYDTASRFFTDESYTPPGGESVPVFRARVRDTFTRIVDEYESLSEALVVVAHGHVCHAFVNEFFGSSRSDGVGAVNAAITIARWEDGSWLLEEASCTVHLEASFVNQARNAVQELHGS